MTGLVEAINHNCGMVAVNVEGAFSIIELLGDEVEVGDQLQFGHYPLGSEWCKNASNGISLNVYFQNHDVGVQQLLQQLLYQNGHRLEMSKRLAKAFQPV